MLARLQFTTSSVVFFFFYCTIGETATLGGSAADIARPGPKGAPEDEALTDQNSFNDQHRKVEINLLGPRRAVELTRFTFRGNVLEGRGDAVDHWMVMFCPKWHDKCQTLLPSYERLGQQWEDKLNTGLFTSMVRFAKVDCATDKALCVSLGVEEYPLVAHF